MNYATIQMQFDYGNTNPMYCPVADVHGILKLEILRKLYKMFDIFIIHVPHDETKSDGFLQELDYI